MEWWIKVDRRHRPVLAESLGFFEKCDKFANQPEHYDHLQHFNDDDQRGSFCAYYNAFQRCFDEEMASRFKFDGY